MKKKTYFNNISVSRSCWEIVTLRHCISSQVISWHWKWTLFIYHFSADFYINFIAPCCDASVFYAADWITASILNLQSIHVLSCAINLQRKVMLEHNVYFMQFQVDFSFAVWTILLSKSEISKNYVDLLMIHIWNFFFWQYNLIINCKIVLNSIEFINFIPVKPFSFCNNWDKAENNNIFFFFIDELTQTVK